MFHGECLMKNNSYSITYPGLCQLASGSSLNPLALFVIYTFPVNFLIRSAFRGLSHAQNYEQNVNRESDAQQLVTAEVV